MRSGTTYFIAERQIQALKPFDYNDPTSNLFRFLLFQVFIIAYFLSAINVNTATPNPGSHEDALMLNETLSKILENLESTKESDEEFKKTVVESLEAISTSLESLEAETGEIAGSVDAILGVVGEIAAAFDLYALEFTEYNLAISGFLLDYVFQDMFEIPDILDNIYYYFTSYPAFGHTRFQNDLYEVYEDFIYENLTSFNDLLLTEIDKTTNAVLDSFQFLGSIDEVLKIFYKNNSLTLSDFNNRTKFQFYDSINNQKFSLALGAQSLTKLTKIETNTRK